MRDSPVQREGEEARLGVAPVVLVPRDLPVPGEAVHAQQGVAAAEGNQLRHKAEEGGAAWLVEGVPVEPRQVCGRGAGRSDPRHVCGRRAAGHAACRAPPRLPVLLPLLRNPVALMHAPAHHRVMPAPFPVPVHHALTESCMHHAFTLCPRPSPESCPYQLLFPLLVCRASSPDSSMGVPRDSSSSTMALRAWRSRSDTTPASPVSPSAPQFHEKLSLVPSRPPSPFASLRLVEYDTRSQREKPSCAVTKLMLWQGRRAFTCGPVPGLPCPCHLPRVLHLSPTAPRLRRPRLVQVRAPAQPRGQRRLHPRVPSQEAPHVVAVSPVPLRPHVPVGEGAHLVCA